LENDKRQKSKRTQWEPKNIKIAYHLIPDQEYQQIIQEVAELIVCGFPQSKTSQDNVSSLLEPKTPLQLSIKSRKRRIPAKV
jgi:hypothetical protein